MTASGTKRTLDELVTLYELEPELSEVITEGRCDAAIVTWFLGNIGINTQVYCVSDRITVPVAEVVGRGLNSGRKGEVIAAALRVEELSADATRRITFIYDVDDDIIASNTRPTAACLLRTDYTSMEMYCFADRPIEKLLRVPLRAEANLKASAVIDAVREGLLEVGFARLALSRVQRPVAMVRMIERRCTVRSGVLRVDLRKLVSDSLDDAGGTKALGVTLNGLVTEIRQARAQWADGDPRLAIRGHDFSRLLCFYLKTHYGNLFREDRTPYKSVQTFQNLLITCLELKDLEGEHLFEALSARALGQVSRAG
jgi:hypothetical protein